ncbi:uncharacterized protein LOC100845661 [Brachypodium distachyon]|uniref:uncharacterized protein LOC100845661 n=1 Tax=Brachypodium distachyon TaxID=15368 RepID=UPI00052FFB58|nr:uncharacterized protein LOC100845661 [Brachypodium distachyon]|eukprot:XP_010240738.1 uncharacterized protein LOC100845661 [Brachypodium distachyon]
MAAHAPTPISSTGSTRCPRDTLFRPLFFTLSVELLARADWDFLVLCKFSLVQIPVHFALVACPVLTSHCHPTARTVLFPTLPHFPDPLLPLPRAAAALGPGAAGTQPLPIPPACLRPYRRRHLLPGARCSARRTQPPNATSAREAASSWAGELAGAVPWKAAVSGALALTLSFSFFDGLVNAKSGANKPELLPKEFTTVIDVAGFLSSGQENRLRQEIEDLEKDTGYKLRVLAQNYPDTPGLAIKDFWQFDDRTIVFVADPTFGNIINFNIGSLIDLDILQSFWSRASGKYGNMFYWKGRGCINVL